MAGSDDDQSSINLSLQLRRGSSDSRDSFYMDFDRGIDSDIELGVDPAAAAADPTPGHPDDERDAAAAALTPARSPDAGAGPSHVVQPGPSHCHTATGQNATEAPGEPILSEESSECSSSSYLEGDYPRATPADWAGLDLPDARSPQYPDSNMPPETHPLVDTGKSTLIPISASFSVPGTNIERRHLLTLPNGNQVIESRIDVTNRGSEDSGLSTNSHLHSSPPGKHPPNMVLDLHQVPPSPDSSFGGSCVSLPATPTSPRRDPRYATPQVENDALVAMLSAMYAKLLVVMGICFPLAEVISHRIPLLYYEGFYLYLYFGSILFLVYVYLFLLRRNPRKGKQSRTKSFFQLLFRRSAGVRNVATNASYETNSTTSKKKVDDGAHCGSFYLRLGAVAFGIGSMIYSGLEFGQFFELEEGSHCYNFLFGLTPGTHMAFTFIQLYFIFLNSRVAIRRYTSVARFGLMHMIATNLCVWLHVLVQETKHQILILINPNVTYHMPSFALESPEDTNARPKMPGFESLSTTDHHRESGHHRVPRSVNVGVYGTHECRRSNIMGQLVQDASQFLFPCTIEYSLICAAVLYIMWKNIGKHVMLSNNMDSSSIRSSVHTRHRHHYQVDCAKANKGLFTGILVLVLSIISLILFFVLINKPQYKNLAVLEAHVVEFSLYIMTSFAVLVAFFQIREMRYNPHRNVELDNILLIVAQTGLYVFTMFSIIGGHFTMGQNTILVLLTAIACLVQGTLQTIFILDASRRSASNSDQVRRKPGREMVTFLLVCNFAMWAINTLETRRADSNPVQMHFYGFWAWTIITHVTTPLTIFFRFHSTVCLCDIWKRTYKLKSEYV